MLFKTFIILILSALLFTTCRREESTIRDSGANIRLSIDSISFDTVFSTIGSVTKNFRVYNPYNENIEISSIRLIGGSLSNFRINVDGRPGSYHEKVSIAPKDSMYVFVEVTVDPNNQSTPFVIEDFIEFVTNGNTSRLKLVAWGQNAHYFTPTTFNRNLPDYRCLNSSGRCSDTIPPVNVTWNNDLPYVIYGYVVIDSLDQLNINPGVRVHFHSNGGLWVYRGGTLKVNGTAAEPVIFQGDRLEPAFQNKPGQWDRIWINDGGFNEINHAIIKNGFIGIQAEELPFGNPPDTSFGRLSIKNTRIENCSGYGILSNLYNIEAENLLVGNCGEFNVNIQAAGRYRFRHCTFGNYYTQASRQTPLFFVKNSTINAIGTQIIGEPEIKLENSIVYGYRSSELETEIINNGAINMRFDHLLLNSNLNLSDTNFYKGIIQNPGTYIFKNPEQGNFNLFETSAARNSGSNSIANKVPLDINGDNRLNDGQPDLGAIEFNP